MSSDERVKFAVISLVNRLAVSAPFLLQCEQAERRMSVTNPHRLLIAQCRLALLELAERLRPTPSEHIGYLDSVPIAE